jgi:hypothetical protein
MKIGTPPTNPAVPGKRASLCPNHPWPIVRWDGSRQGFVSQNGINLYARTDPMDQVLPARKLEVVPGEPGGARPEPWRN